MNVKFLTEFKRDKNNNIIWNENLDKYVDVLYNNKIYKIYIKDKVDSKFLYIDYLGKEYKMWKSNFKKGTFGRIFGEYSKDFKIEIGQEIKDDKRDLVIIDREYKKDNKGRNWKWYKYHCNKCNNEDWIVENSLLNESGCNVCCTPSRKVLQGYNDIYTTDYWMVELGVLIEDAKKYSHGSGQRIKVKCPNCGKEKKISPSEIYVYKSICCTCGDGISYPEKLVMSLLNQLNINYVKEYSSYWTDNKRYDFYFKLDNKKHIIETHGGQHYNKSNGYMKDFEFQQYNDKYKKELALNNGVDYYIELDCRESNLEWIKNSIINSELNNIFNLSNIDWLKCEEFALSNRVKEVCDYWRLHNEINNEGLTTDNLASIFNITKPSICSYLNKGNKLGWCNYITLKSKADNNIEIVKNMLYNGEYNMEHIKDTINVSRETLRNYLKTILSKEDFEKIKKYNSENRLNKKPKYKKTPVICVNTGEIFESIKIACDKYNIKSTGNLHSCCKGTRNYCGTNLETGEKLKWKFYNN